MTSKKKLKKALRAELAARWHDLRDAQDKSLALPGYRSMREDSVRETITELTALVGLTPWPQIPCPLLLNGTYQELAGAMGYGPDHMPPADAHRHCDHAEGYER